MRDCQWPGAIKWVTCPRCGRSRLAWNTSESSESVCRECRRKSDVPDDDGDADARDD